MTAAAAPQVKFRAPSPAVQQLQEFWHYFSENRGAVAGLVIIVSIILIALLADLIAPHSPIEVYSGHDLKPPAWQEGGDWAFPLGTDALGRDILSRIIHGSRFSLFIGGIVVSIAVSIGIALGLVAGFLANSQGRTARQPLPNHRSKGF